MTTTQWLLIILLVLLIAVGIWMLMRKPPSGQDRSPEMDQDSAGAGAAGAGVSSYDAGGEHVAAGEAGVASGSTLYDQEADARTEEEPSATGYDDGRDQPVSSDEMWDEVEQPDEGSRQDTATGADVPVVEEEPVVSDHQDGTSEEARFDQDDPDAQVDPLEQTDSFGEVGNGDRDQMSYGDSNTEDFASETTYAIVPVEETLAPTADDAAQSHDLGAGSPGTDVHEEMLDLEHEQALDAGETDDGAFVPHGAGSEDLGPEEGEDASSGIPADATHQEHDDVPEDAAAAGFVVDLHGSVNEHPSASDPEPLVVEAHEEDTVEDRDTHVVETTEPEGHTEAEQSDEHEAPPSEHHDSDDEHTDDEPQAVMVDVEDYPATSTETHDEDTVEDRDIQSDHENEENDDVHVVETPERDHQAEAEQSDEHEGPPSEHQDANGGVADTDVENEPIVVADDQQAPEDETSDQAEPSEPVVVASPYGPGSVFADEDGSVPSGYDIKGNAGSMLFHTPESPSYESSVPEVYFDSEDAARAAGFAHWDRKRR